MIDLGVKVSHYKCFKDIPSGFECIKPINLIIGRNNTGKSTILDLVHYLCQRGSTIDQGSKVHFDKILTEEELSTVFKDNQRQHQFLKELGAQQWSRFGVKLIGRKISWSSEVNSNNNNKIINTDNFHAPYFSPQQSDAVLKVLTQLCQQLNRSGNYSFRRLLADRDITSEPQSDDRTLSFNGIGATNIVQRFITSVKYPREMVQVTLLNSLNEIFQPDALFDEINIQVHDGVIYSESNYVFGLGKQPENQPEKWEVFLSEKSKGLIALSKSGSGLKTVILVLLNLLIIPRIEGKEVKDYIFAFEELENNLHPSLLRRLHKFLLKFALENGCHIFLTTHSNIAIDQFAGNDNSQIIHVKHNGTEATTETIDSHIGRSELLDDLGAKASDILQSNGLVWLEGPSDRIYFNKWIEIFSDGTLKEGRDYECVFYGGSNLASFEAKDSLDEETLKEKINIMKINRNAILIGDSDKTSKRMKLKGRLAQIKPQMEKVGAYIWITKAKEIENYIPVEALEKHFEKDGLPAIELYQQFSYEPSIKTRANAKNKPKGYLQKNKIQKTEKYDKVKLAREISEFFDKETQNTCFELQTKIEDIIKEIQSWNEIKS